MPHPLDALCLPLPAAQLSTLHAHINLFQLCFAQQICRGFISVLLVPPGVTNFCHFHAAMLLRCPAAPQHCKSSTTVPLLPLPGDAAALFSCRCGCHVTYADQQHCSIVGVSSSVPLPRHCADAAVLSPAVVAIMLPTLLSSTAEAVQDFSAELALSRFESVLMLLCYGLFLVFQLVTHRWAGRQTNLGIVHSCMDG